MKTLKSSKKQPLWAAKKNMFPITIRFHTLESVNTIKQAAKVMGMSFNNFVLTTSRDAAGIVLKLPTEKTPGELVGENIVQKK